MNKSLTTKTWEKKAQKVHFPSRVGFFGLELRVVCCIYHRPKEFGESSSDESPSSSSSDDESDDDLDGSRGRDNHENEDHDCEQRRQKRVLRQKGKPSPNAYERQPHSRKEKDEKLTTQATPPK